MANMIVGIDGSFQTLSQPLNHGALTVGTTAVELKAGATKRYQVVVYNNSANTVYIGDNNVSIANGYPMPANGQIAFSCNPETPVSIYGIASADSEVRVVELA